MRRALITLIAVTALVGPLTLSAPAQDNAPPHARDDRATTQRDLTVLVEVLANDEDPDGDTLRVIEQVVDPPEHGEAQVNEDGTITFDPDRAFTGTDGFTYHVLDDEGGEDTARVIVEVEAGGDHPPRQSLPAVFRPVRDWFFVERLPPDGEGARRAGTLPGCSGDRGAPFFGDWDEDGRDTPATFGGGDWHLGNGGYEEGCDSGTDLRLRYGRRGDIPVTGDWNGDGIEDIGVIRVVDRTLTWLLETDTRDGHTWTDGRDNISFRYGSRTRGDLADTPVIGDWNGDGVDDAGMVRVIDGRVSWLLETDSDATGRTTSSDGRAEITFGYGSDDRGDRVVVGDWDADGTDNAGVVRGNNLWLLETDTDGAGLPMSDGAHDHDFRFGSRPRGDVFLTYDETRLKRPDDRPRPASSASPSPEPSPSEDDPTPPTPGPTGSPG